MRTVRERGEIVKMGGVEQHLHLLKDGIGEGSWLFGRKGMPSEVMVGFERIGRVRRAA